MPETILSQRTSIPSKSFDLEEAGLKPAKYFFTEMKEGGETLPNLKTGHESGAKPKSEKDRKPGTDPDPNSEPKSKRKIGEPPSPGDKFFDTGKLHESLESNPVVVESWNQVISSFLM